MELCWYGQTSTVSKTFEVYVRTHVYMHAHAVLIQVYTHVYTHVSTIHVYGNILSLDMFS